MNKRITSLLLCFLMVFSMLTTTAGHTHAVSKPTVSIEASVATAKPGDEVELTLYFQSPVDTIGGQVFVDLPEGLTYVSCDLDTNRYAALDVMDALGMIEGDVDWVAESMQMFFAGMAGYPLPNVADAPVALATIICKVDEDAAPGTYNIGISSTSADGTIVGGIGNGDGDMLAASAYDLVGTSITVEGAEPAGKPVVSMEANKETAKAGDEVEFTLYFQSSVDTIGGQVFVDLPEGLTYVSCNLDTDRYAALDVMDALGMVEGDVDWVAESMQMFFAGMAGYPLPNVADAPVALATIVCKVDEDAAPGTYNIGISSASADGTIVGGIGNGDGDMLAESAYDLVGTSITVEGAEPAGKPTVSMKANKETVNAGEEVEFTLYFQSDVDTIGGQVFVDLPEGLTYVSCNLDTDRYAALDVMDALGMVEGDVDWVAESMQMFFAGMAGYPLPNVADAPVALATIVCKVDEDAASGTYNIGISSTSADGTIVGGIGNGDGDMLADSEYDLVGTSIEVVGAAACNHEWSTTLVNTDPAGHYYECSKCGEKKDEEVHSATDDKDCTTADLCSCGYVVTAAGEHTPEADDGDCQTPVGCTKCDQTVVAAKTHVAAADDNDCTTPVLCTNDGCTQEVVPAKPHTEETVPGKAATCEDTGLTDGKKCSVCGMTLVEQEEIAALGHTEGEPSIEDVVDATCTAEGSYCTVIYCTVCDLELSHETTMVDRLPHTEGEPVIEDVIDATCTAEGSYCTVIYCTVCNLELSHETTTVDPLPHTEGEPVVENEVAADCTNAGSYDTVIYCSVCDAEISRVTTTVDALGHTEGQPVVENEVAADCTTEGSYDTVVYCSVCNEELSRETTTVDALGHTKPEASVKENEKPASCGADGSYDEVLYCAVCGEEISRTTITVPSTGEHVYATEKERVDATCTADGYVIKACACGATEKTALTATGHTEGQPVVENEVAADCETEGSYDTVVYCSVCNEELSRETTTVDALGHTEGEPVVENEVAADCETEGSYDTVVYCSVCNEELSRETTTVDALGHTEGEPVVENEVAADCDTAGSYDTVVYCSVCNTELSRVTTTVDALGHTEGEPVVENEVAADCDTPGSYDTVVYCSVCNAELSRVPTTVDALGHTEGEPVVENEVAADCDTPGSYDTVVYCSVCNEELSRETTTVDALGHTEGEPVIENEVEPTCENTGSYDTVVYCSVCNEELSRVTTTVDTLDHIEGEDDGDCSTAVTCVNCDYVFVEAKQHDFSGDWHDDKAEGHYHSCGNDGCEQTDEIVEHIPGPPPTPANPQVCTECGYVLAEATGLYVNSVEATVTKPVVGKTPDYNVTLKSDPANKVELSEIVWFKIAEEDYTGTYEDSWTTMEADEVFEEGYVYSCDIYLNTVDGYWVAEDVTGKVNGKAHDDSYGGVYSSETELYLAQDFKPIDPSNPQTGDNSNMTLWIAMLVLSGAGVIGTMVYDRKKKRVYFFMFLPQGEK